MGVLESRFGDVFSFGMKDLKILRWPGAGVGWFFQFRKQCEGRG